MLFFHWFEVFLCVCVWFWEGFLFVCMFKVSEITQGLTRIMLSNEAEHVLHVLENDMRAPGGAGV